jgi:serine/threonine protein kinase
MNSYPTPLKESLTFLNMEYLTLKARDLADIVGLKQFRANNCANILSIPYELFAGSVSLEEVTFKMDFNLAEIASNAFRGASNVTALNLIELRALIVLPADSFVGLSGLTDLNIINEQGGVSTIVQGVFTGLDALKRINLHLAKLVTVEASVFAHCTALEVVTISGAPLLVDLPVGLFDGAAASITDLVFAELGISNIDPALFTGMDKADTLKIACCKELLSLYTEQFAGLTNLVRLSIENNNKLAELAPQTFKGLSKLQELDLTGHPLLARLVAGTFDYAFDPTATSVVVNLENNALESIAPRAINFDANGVPPQTIVILSSAPDTYLDSCCAYEWIVLETHFVTTGLDCNNVKPPVYVSSGGAIGGLRGLSTNNNTGAGCEHGGVNTQVQRLTDPSTEFGCCYTQGWDADIEFLHNRAIGGDGEQIGSYNDLSTDTKDRLSKYCKDAKWNGAQKVVDIPRLDNTSTPLPASEQCSTPTACPPELVEFFELKFDPAKQQCIEDKCPEGTRLRGIGRRYLLDCEPWLHEERPYDTRYAVSVRQCEKCAVLHCFQCDENYRQCSRCNDGYSLHVADGTGIHTCVPVGECPGDMYSAHYIEGAMNSATAEDAMWKARLSLLFDDDASTDSLDTTDDTTYTNTAPNTTQDDLVQEDVPVPSCEMRTVCGDGQVEASAPSELEDRKCVATIDDDETNTVVLIISAGVGAFAIVGLVWAAVNYGHSRRRHADLSRRTAHLNIIAAADKGSHSVEVLDGMLFEAIDLDCLGLVSKLLAHGADAAQRNSEMQLPMNRLFANFDKTTYHRPKSIARTPTPSQAQRMRSARRGIAPAPDEGGHGLEDVQSAVHQLLEAHCEFDLHMQTKLLESDIANSMMNAAVGTMAADKWRAPQTQNTVAHQLLVACQERTLTEEQSMEYLDRVILYDNGILTVSNAHGQSPTDIAMLCEGKTELQARFTVVLFQHYQVARLQNPLYKSSTCEGHACCDLRQERRSDGNREKLALKLVGEPTLWLRELQVRDGMEKKGGFIKDSIVSPSSASFVVLKDIDAKPMRKTSAPLRRVMTDEKETACDLTMCKSYAATMSTKERPLIVFPSSLLKNCPREEAREKMTVYPYALAMPLADRSLNEIIMAEHLADEPLDEVRKISLKLLNIIGGVHEAGVIHGDIKPNNVVRMEDRSIRLIDFDMGIVLDSPDEEIPHTKPDRFFGSTAYTTPELHAWMRKTQQNNSINPYSINATSPLDLIETPEQIDLWAFGVTLYEMSTGSPLFENSYDRVTPAALARLLGWQGLDSTCQQHVESLHGKGESAALRDLLMWALDPSPSNRPKSVADIRKHAFFDPRGGSLRVHFQIDELKALLAMDIKGRLDVNVMVSYCWADTNFVLGQLVMQLATRVRTIWLDRLGGDQGMGEFARNSMERGVENADFVIAVVSPSYIDSAACGFEMEMANQHNKPVIPVVYNLPFAKWPPKSVGTTTMTNQFATPSGDVKIFVEMTDFDAFNTKFEKELIPRLTRGIPGAPGHPLIVTRTVSEREREDGSLVGSKSAIPERPRKVSRGQMGHLGTIEVQSGAEGNLLDTSGGDGKANVRLFDATGAGVPDTVVQLAVATGVDGGDARGICGVCGKPVLSTQPRDRDDKTDTYYHQGCTPLRADAMLDPLQIGKSRSVI